MPHVTPGCELRLYLCNAFPSAVIVLNSMVFDFEVVKAAPSIKTDVDCEVNDEQFLCLRASDLYLQTPRISEKGLNGLILVRNNAIVCPK
ncbi:unnamed protein product [Cylicostephanus goldi]|uniref:Uncharacterized protein n=1 Tax=Cylicostephanus goldi TaxID=71465 RepID=A0A3P7N992_CYLGO|nr:unnamed protein product [Cylicostephanus goldi]